MRRMKRGRCQYIRREEPQMGIQEVRVKNTEEECTSRSLIQSWELSVYHLLPVVHHNQVTLSLDAVFLCIVPVHPLSGWVIALFFVKDPVVLTGTCANTFHMSATEKHQTWCNRQIEQMNEQTNSLTSHRKWHCRFRTWKITCMTDGYTLETISSTV